MGASVVRIDRPGRPSPQDDADFVNGGRTAVTLDLKTSRDVQLALSLLSKADALIEGLRPGVMERLGLGPDACHCVNPSLVYARMTGWGQNGPLANRAGHDINYIALSGALHAIGPTQRPSIPLNLIGDYGGGGAFLAIGILAALLHARRTGQGEVMDTAMIDGASFLMALPYARLGTGKWVDFRAQNLLDGGAPWYDVYTTRDGKFVAVGAIEPKFYANLLSKLGIEPESLPPREDRERWPIIRERFEQVFLSQTRNEWAARFEDIDACVTPVLSMREAPLHPHNQARHAFVDWEGTPVPTAAPRTSEPSTRYRTRSERTTVEQILERWST